MDQASGMPLVNTAPPPTPVNPVVAAPPPAPSVPPLTAIPVPTAPTEPKKKSKIWLIILLVILALIAIIGGGLFYLSKLVEKPHSVYLPTFLPAGFHLKEMGQTKVDSSTKKRYFEFLYVDQGGGEFILVEQEGEALECKPPSPPSAENRLELSDYTEFRPNGSDLGCAVTLTTSTVKKRSFQFQKNNIKFTILMTGILFTDDVALDMANSFTQQTVKVVETSE